MVRVKICGITSVSDAIHAADCGSDAIGMVFYPPSPRAVQSLTVAREISLCTGAFVCVVALFVDPDPSEVYQVLEHVPVNLIQFHGSESESFCMQFSRPYIKALRMKKGIDVQKEIAKFSSASGILLDAYVKGVPGGTGEAFDWARVPRGRQDIILAGGLTPQNVKDAVRQTQPYAVDVSGGVESSHGKKDPSKVADFIRNSKLSL